MEGDIDLVELLGLRMERWKGEEHPKRKWRYGLFIRGVKKTEKSTNRVEPLNSKPKKLKPKKPKPMLLGGVSFVFGVIADAFGGASFNAIGTVAFSIAGAGGEGDTFMSNAVRFPAQAVGAVAGVLALTELMPLEYKHMLEGPSLKVDLHTGAIAEGVLTFLITFVVLIIIIKGPKSFFTKNWMPSVATMAVIIPGSSYTGPSMNPANEFAWAYLDNKHNVIHGSAILRILDMPINRGNFGCLFLQTRLPTTTISKEENSLKMMQFWA